MQKSAYLILPMLLMCVSVFSQKDASDSQVDRAGYFLLFSGEPDLSAARNYTDKEAKGRFVMEQLRKNAQTSQANAMVYLKAHNIPHRPYYLVNAIWVNVTSAELENLAVLPGVHRVMEDARLQVEQPLPSRDPVQFRDETEWGVNKINAPEVWAQGYTGQGVVIGGQDTGYDWDHPAIKNQYRGWDGQKADHDYNWHDAIHQLNPLNNDTTNEASNNPCGLDSPVPCDDHNHGTHTMGTMVGDDGMGNKIGVAPGATWISCRNMERGWGMLSTYLECFEWFLAPTDLNDENPDPAKAPHVINNSWRCPEVEGCDSTNWQLLETAINNLRSAGVVVVASAGNEGSGCGSVNAPPAIFEGSFSIGATGQNDTIAGFSSRGQVTVDGSFRLKPNVAAPGVGVRSCIRGGGYASFSGTSMAGPHVAGLVALLISAKPELAGQVEQIESIIEATAKPMYSDQDCGIDGEMLPNPVYGYGRVDALAAVSEALNPTGTKDEANPEGVKLFPNPASDAVWLDLGQGIGGFTFELFAPDGKRVLTRRGTAEFAQMIRVGIDHLPPGLYAWHLRGETGQASGRLLVR